jgi:hypothetical protein
MPRWWNVLVVGLLFSTQAAGHDHWINRGRYTNPKTGELCCGEQDCEMVPVEHVKITPQGYRLPSGEVVPYSEAQTSEDGQYWRCRRFDAAKSRRCFFAPERGT